MTASSQTTAPIAPPVLPCPSWCTLPADHTYDSYNPDSGVMYRGHGGVTFGPFVSVGGDERSDGQPMTLDAAINGDEVEDQVSDAASLRALAGDLVRAAEWLEAHQ